MNRDLMLQTLRQQSVTVLTMLAKERGVSAELSRDELAYILSAAMTAPQEPVKPRQITARQAIPGTVVYVSIPQGGIGAGVREHAVTVGSWRPSRLGQGWADLHDSNGKFWTVAAADDLLYIEPASSSLPAYVGF